MKYLVFIPALLAACALAVIVFFENLPKLCYNAFHKKKKKINWNPMDYMDDSESFYHK